jgi:ADP-ribosylglycohydrolase
MLRKAVSIGGDSNTIACITASIAEAFYGGVPEDIKIEVLEKLNENMRKIVSEFYERFIIKR